MECASLSDGNKANKDGNTPLFWASDKGHSEVVKLLLAAPGIHVNRANKEGNTPLHFASKEGHVEVEKLLLRVPGIDVNRADVALRYGRRRTPLEVAKNDEIRALLRAAGAIN